jgi:Xaa-Pro dipeptidase
MAVELVRPAISAELVEQHLERAADLLAAHAVDGLFVFRNTNILAFCGVPLAPGDRLVCGLVNADGRAAAVVPAFEAPLLGGLSPGIQLVTWEEHEDPYAAVAEAARLLGITSGTIFLDGHTWTEIQTRLQDVLPGVSLHQDAGVIEAVRITKSPEEIEAICAAARDTCRIYPLVAKRLRAGISEGELGRDVLNQLRGAGLSPWGDLIQGGETASVPHQTAGSRLFQDGDAVIVDFVCQKEGYLADMTRTFALGRPDGDIRRAYAVVRDAQRAAFEAVRPGVTCASVDHAARAVIQRAGLGEYFIHRVGHGIGLDVHEPPYLVRGNQECLKPGMCVTIEPGVYVPGRFGIRIEDVVTVTEDGHQRLTNSVPTDVSEVFK